MKAANAANAANSVNAVPPTDLIDEVDVGGLKVATIRAALELDVFTHIANGHDTVAAIAAASACDEAGMARLVNALLSLQALEREDGRLRNSPAAAAYMVRGAEGDAIDINLAWLRNRDHLVSTIRDGRVRAEPLTSAHWVSYARPELVRWSSRVGELSAAFADRGVCVSSGSAVLDVGCGSGLVGYSLILDVPGARVTGIDAAPVLDVARALAQRMQIEDRVRLVPGDHRSLDEHVEHSSIDVALLVNVAHYLTEGELLDALRSIRTTMRPGGTLVVSSLVDDAGTPGYQPNWTGAIEMLLAAPGIALRSGEQVMERITSAGFDRVTQHRPWSFTAHVP